jgi:hypothetical protein
MKRSKPGIPQPAKWQVEEGPTELVIVRPWNRQLGYFGLVFVAFWGLFLIFPLLDLLGEPSVANVLTSLGLFSLCGTSLYLALAQFFNQTTVRVSYDELSVRIGPLPWPGKFEIFRADAKQLFVREHTSTNKNGSRTYSYSLHLVDAQKKHHRLVYGLRDSQEARFLEQKVEQYLRVKDEPIKGEYQG